jgi:hypothetical protein
VVAVGLEFKGGRLQNHDARVTHCVQAERTIQAVRPRVHHLPDPFNPLSISLHGVEWDDEFAFFWDSLCLKILAL